MSRYENYAIKNNVFGTLSAPISSLATTIQLNSWQWARFSVNQLATLENVEDWKVKKREIVKITAIAWDVLTVVRKYAPCPSSDDANTQWQVSYAFSADDTISAYITKEHFDKIDDSINDIYDNWVNKLRTEVISWLQIKVNAWPVLVGSWYYDFAWWNLTLTDNTTNYVEIDEDWLLVFNTSGRNNENSKIAKVITSWWAITSIEDWRLWTVWGKIWWLNIHELTEKQSISSDDELVITDSENIWQNKKIKYRNTNTDKLFEYLLVWEKYTANDKLFKQSTPAIDDCIVQYNVWDISTNTKVQIQRIASWISSNKIKLRIKKAWNPSVSLHCDVYEWETYDISWTESAWKATWTAIATSSLASSDFSNNWQEITFTLNNNVGWTKGQLLSIVVYQDNNTVNASNYYIIWCDATQWSEAFRLIAYDNNSTYTPSYLMPYCNSDAFAKYLLCKVDSNNKTISATAIFSKTWWNWSYTVPGAWTYLIDDTALKNTSWWTVTASFSLPWINTSAFYLVAYADDTSIYQQYGATSGSASLADWKTIRIWVKNNYNFDPKVASWSSFSVSFSVSSVTLEKQYQIYWYSFDLSVKNIANEIQRVFLWQYADNKYTIPAIS